MGWISTPTTHPLLKHHDYEEIYGGYPCPFPPVRDGRAYYHFTGNVKPWTKWNQKNKQFQLWYDAVSASGDINVRRDIFNGQPEPGAAA